MALEANQNTLVVLACGAYEKVGSDLESIQVGIRGWKG